MIIAASRPCFSGLWKTLLPPPSTYPNAFTPLRKGGDQKPALVLPPFEAWALCPEAGP